MPSNFNPALPKGGTGAVKKDTIPVKYTTTDFIKPERKTLDNMHPKQVVYFATSHIYYNNSIHNHLKWLTYTWLNTTEGFQGRQWVKHGDRKPYNPHDESYMEEYYGRVWFWGNSQPIMWHGDLSERLSGKFGPADWPVDVALFQCNYLYNNRSILHINEHKEFYMNAFDQCRQNNVEPTVFMHAERIKRKNEVGDHEHLDRDYAYMRNLWTDIANLGDALVIPWGVSVHNWYNTYPEIPILNPWCGNHPNNLGTILMTYTIFYTYYRVDPRGIDYTYIWEDIDKDTLFKLQTIAKESVDEYFA
jgi:hypothetical protein